MSAEGESHIPLKTTSQDKDDSETDDEHIEIDSDSGWPRVVRVSTMESSTPFNNGIRPNSQEELHGELSAKGRRTFFRPGQNNISQICSKGRHRSTLNASSVHPNRNQGSRLSEIDRYEATSQLLELRDTSVLSSENTLQNTAPSKTACYVAKDFPSYTQPRWLTGVEAAGPELDSEQINAKVREMLIAIDALKPKLAAETTPGSSKLSRIASIKVFSKISGVWSRLQSKSASPESEARQDQIVLTPEPPRTPMSMLQTKVLPNRASVSSIRLRANEGLNLNRNKVQHIVGGVAMLKHVRENGESLFGAASGRLDMDTYRFPTSAMTKGSYERIRHSCSTLSSDLSPFDSEDGFERNLDDGILKTTPAGSSTPRLHIQQASDSFASEGSTDFANGSSSGEIDLAKVMKVEQHGAIATEVREVMVQPTRAKKQACNGPTNVPAMSERRQRVKLDHFECVKKHPSPSKSDLERLGAALQRRLPDDSDELASGSDPLAHSALSQRDQNQTIRWCTTLPEKALSRLSVTSNNAMGHPNRPHNSHEAHRPVIRLAPPYRPKVSYSEEPDELF